jgi:N-methylhydantoinase B
MARSPAVMDEGQHACAILDAAGRLVAQEQGEPSQLAAVQSTVAWLVDAFAFDVAEGDAILAGDPHCGGTFAGTLTLTAPLAHEGEIAYFVAIRFACPDLAGDIPGPFQPTAHEIWQESLRVTPVKLARAGAPQRDVRRYILRNSRAPDHLDADLTAAEAAARQVAGRLGAMIAARGGDLVRSAADYRIAHARARLASHLRGIAAATGEASLPGTAGMVRVSTAPGNDGIIVDFSGTSDATESAANLTPAATAAVVLAQLAAPVIEDAGMSQGILDAVTLVLPPGLCVSAAAPAAVSLGWREVAPAVSTALARATRRQPAFAPSPPLVVLFPEIGAAPVALPMTLSPGFLPRAETAGGDAAAGRRRLISAEQAEVEGVVSILHREFDGGGISAEVEVRRASLEGIVVPGAEVAPDIRQTAPLARERSNVLALAVGARIRFTYPERKETLP